MRWLLSKRRLTPGATSIEYFELKYNIELEYKMAIATTEGRRERRKEAVKARLLDAAVSLFATRGYQGTAVSDIADLADVARTTAFNYFPRKEDYFFAWMDARRADIRSTVGAETTAGRTNPGQLLRQSFARLADFYEADAALSRPMTLEWIRFGGPMTKGASDTSTLITEVIARGQRQGQISAEIDAVLLGLVILDVYLGALYRWASAEDDTPLKGPLLQSLEYVLAPLGGRGEPLHSAN
jgi:TetR/AcrR family transcriptional regulator, cholesterol catabolism regulator